MNPLHIQIYKDFETFVNNINSLSIDRGCGRFKIKQRHKFLSIYFIFIINMVLHVLLLLKFLNSHRKHNDNAVVQKLRRILMLLIHKPIVCPKIFLLHIFLDYSKFINTVHLGSNNVHSIAWKIPQDFPFEMSPVACQVSIQGLKQKGYGDFLCTKINVLRW